jgi:hypothetical protein
MDFDYEYPPKPSLVEDINPDKCLFISINNYSGAYFEQDEKGLELSPVPDKYKDNTCILHFDDVAEGCISTRHVPYKVFNKNMAKQIYTQSNGVYNIQRVSFTKYEVNDECCKPINQPIVLFQDSHGANSAIYPTKPLLNIE